MLVETIKLQNYRNFITKEINFEPNINCIIAPNGCGKTNIIEAISYLSVPKSFRRVLDKNLINNQIKEDKIHIEDLENELLKNVKIFSRVNGKVCIDKGEFIDFEIFLKENIKILKINSKKVSTSKFVGNFYSVLFSPEIIDLLISSPSKRRNYIDRLISTFNPEYLDILSKYKEVLKNRNRILSDFRNYNEDVLKIVDIQLIEKGVNIYKDRLEFFSEISNNIDVVNKEILKEDRVLSIKYLPSIGDLDNINSLDELKDAFTESVLKNRTIDYRRGYSQVGPHRDDFRMTLNRYDLDKFGSRGQQRMGILSFLFSYIAFLNKLNKKPVILLDDVFSELDRVHRKLLMEYIISNDFQVIITTSEKDEVLNEYSKEINYIEL